MKILKRISLSVIFIILILAVILWIFLNGTKPKISGVIKTEHGEISDKVTINRNKWGIPYIKGESKEDIFWGTGFVHASDRLFQMDLIRRLTTGRLAEIFGERALGSDIFHKELLIEEGIERVIKDIKPDVLKILKSYCKGVNFYIENRNLPPEFKILGYKPEKWEIKDIFSIFKRMEIILAGSGSELRNMKLVSILGKENASKLISGLHGSTIIDKEEYGNFLKNNSLQIAFGIEQDNNEKIVGSNNWVLSGDKTESGKPILANDPHLSNVFPSYFYQVLLRTGDIELSGNTIPGVPFVILGRNNNIGWGVTNLGTDVIDYYILKINPDNEDQYSFEDSWINFDTLEKVIKVKGKEDIKHTIKMSKFGPVFEVEGKYLAKYSLNMFRSTVIEAFYGMNFSKNISDFIDSLKKFSSPAQNVVFADTKGNIGYYPTGLVPVRPKGSGIFPVKGESKSDLWQGFYDEDKKPFLVNPSKGFIATANNRVLPENGIPLFADNWSPSFRGDRITELIRKLPKLSMEYNMEMHSDSYLKSAEFLMEIISSYDFGDGDAGFVMKELKKWNKRVDSGIAPSLFYRFEYHLAQNIFKDNMGNEKDFKMISNSWIYKVFDYPLGDPDKDKLKFWIDDVNTERAETLFDLVKISLEESYRDYKNNMEKGDTGWKDLHTLFYKHPLGSVFPLKYFLNRGPYGITGGKDCVAVSTFRNRAGFNVVHLSTFRMIIDFKDFSNSRMANSSGQSGHFLSPWYDDQIDLYINSKYR
ncbi:MAG: penicillin acylase family protein, partial [Acidobacteriota bacterium]